MTRIYRQFLMVSGVVGVVVAAGCKEEAGVDVTADVNEQRLCAEMAEILCHNFFRCCRGEEIEADFGITLSTTEAACRADAELRCEEANAAVLGALARGRITLNEKKIDACLDQYIAEEDKCFPIVANFAAACDEQLITGKQRPGKPCLHDFECVDAAYCGTNRECKPYPGEGDACSPRVGCAPGSFCRFNGATEAYECLARRTQNDGCDATHDCAGALVCKPLDEPSAEGYTGICKPPKKLNETCESHTECTTGYCLPALCEDGIRECFTNGHCPRYCETSGVMCSGDDHCPGHCDDGTVCLDDCPAECPRETCVAESQCMGRGVCDKRYEAVSYCNFNLVNVFGCGDGEFKCDNSACIDGSYQCDGIYDCTDGSDETRCGG